MDHVCRGGEKFLILPRSTFPFGQKFLSGSCWNLFSTSTYKMFCFLHFNKLYKMKMFNHMFLFFKFNPLNWFGKFEKKKWLNCNYDKIILMLHWTQLKYWYTFPKNYWFLFSFSLCQWHEANTVMKGI